MSPEAGLQEVLVHSGCLKQDIIINAFNISGHLAADQTTIASVQKVIMSNQPPSTLFQYILKHIHLIVPHLFSFGSEH